VDPRVGSLETMEFCARRRYAYMSIPFFSFRTVKRMGELFREQCEKQGYTAHPSRRRSTWASTVAPTDAEAWERFERHFWYCRRTSEGHHRHQHARLHVDQIDDEPGRAHRRVRDLLLDARRPRARRLRRRRSPETVRQKLSGMLRALGTGNLLMSCHYGDMDIRTYDDSMRLFVSDVLPKLRAEFAHQDAIPYPRRSRCSTG
jgi:alkanesulfonate monooxygenase SsuD/methylene tetrahydromethanopterin reductase-like flavin-dependent oxidoreductase (luciferase family)